MKIKCFTFSFKIGSQSSLNESLNHKITILVLSFLELQLQNITAQYFIYTIFTVLTHLKFIFKGLENCTRTLMQMARRKQKVVLWEEASVCFLFIKKSGWY